MSKADILNKIISRYGLRTKAELAKHLGVSPQTLSNWYGRDTLDHDVIIDKCPDLDLNWLFRDNSSDYPMVARVSVASDRHATYDAGGPATVSVPVVWPGEGGDDSEMKLTLPEKIIGAGDYVAYMVSDTSMQPVYPFGDLVIAKRVVDVDSLAGMGPTACVLALYDGKFLFRRVSVQKSASRRFVLSADNPDKRFFPDSTVAVREVRAVWSVCMTLSPADPQNSLETLSRKYNSMERRISEINEAGRTGK